MPAPSHVVETLLLRLAARKLPRTPVTKRNKSPVAARQSQKNLKVTIKLRTEQPKYQRQILVVLATNLYPRLEITNGLFMTDCTAELCRDKAAAGTIHILPSAAFASKAYR